MIFSDFLNHEIKTLKQNNWVDDKEINPLFLNTELQNAINSSTSPIRENIFNALKLVSYNNVKVLILGQDPYPNPLDAHGLAFSSKNNITPGSLKNIFIAIDKVYGSDLFKEKYNELTNWANQGVLLLNTSLTFQKIKDDNLDKTKLQKLQQKNQSYHLKLWKPFINHIILKLLNVKKRPIVMFLWGDKAQKLVFGNIKKNNINIEDNILILSSSHPSPLSVNRGGDFLELAPVHFKMCNEFLEKFNSNKIKWTEL